MTPPRIERRLAAILAADVTEYSQLMGADEVGTLAALKAHRRVRIAPKIASHSGRIVKTTGDGLLVEFASVVDAVACAVAVQRAMLAFNADVPAYRRMVLRIGINLGDIIIDGGDIFGDGVNVAARLEALCEPGGVCISRSANEQVRDKLSLAFADLGEQTVKNIARPVGVFGLAAKDIAALPEEPLTLPEAPAPQPGAPGRPARAVTMLVGTVLSAAVLVAGGWWLLREPAPPQAMAPTAPAAAPRPAALSPQDRRMSLIVLPFENGSGDPEQDGLAAHLTRDVTDFRAREVSVPVIPAATAAAYHGRSLDLRAIGRDYNVHFALTGSVRRQNGRLIVSATMNDLADLRQVWSQHYDRPDQPEELGPLAWRIANDSQQAATDAEVARAMRDHPGDLDKVDLMLAASTTRLQQTSKENLSERLALAERALKLDPDLGWALSQRARAQALLVITGLAPDADLAAAAKAADRAILLAPASVEALRTKATVLRAQGDLDGAAALLRQVIRLEPFWGFRYNDLGTILMMQGQAREALGNYLTARRLALQSDPVSSIDSNIAMALLATGQFPEAIAQAQLAIAEFTPESGRIAEYPWLALIAAETANGQDGQARTDLQKFLATPRTLRSMAQIQKIPLLAANPALLDGLIRAGMPADSQGG
ncbi:MAG: Guanylate cyclase [Myxococcales bacterium]|nr:Guanylate cyclase [Myxococcales bacterium]